MGNLCSSPAPIRVNKRTIAPLADDADGPGGPENVHVVLIALDYKGTGNELTCSADGRNMEALLRACGIDDVTALYDNDGNKEKVEEVVREIGQRCGDDDFFVFYYSGHGTSMVDTDGDEADGKDEAFCFVGEDGSLSADTFMSDDDFAAMVTDAIPEGVKIIILTDCCHSGSIADLNRPCWRGRQAISMAGCLDGQTSGDIGKGGIMTHSMLMAIDKIRTKCADHYSVGMLYNTTLDYDDSMFNSEQDITMQHTSSVTPDAMVWPLAPSGDYKAPMNNASSGAMASMGMLGGSDDNDDGGGLLSSVMGNDFFKQQLEQQLQAQGIPPSLISIFMNSSMGHGVEPDFDHEGDDW